MKKTCYHCGSTFKHEGDPVDGNNFCSYICAGHYIDEVNQLCEAVGMPHGQAASLHQNIASSFEDKENPKSFRKRCFLLSACLLTLATCGGCAATGAQKVPLGASCEMFAKAQGRTIPNGQSKAYQQSRTVCKFLWSESAIDAEIHESRNKVAAGKQVSLSIRPSSKGKM